MEQGSLMLRSAREDEVNDTVVLRCKDFRAAIRLCVESSGLAPKDVAFQLNIDKGHFSRMIGTEDDPRHFPPELLLKLMDICANEIPLRWLAFKRNYRLERLQSAVELELEQVKRQLREEREEREREMATTLKILREIRA